MAKVTLTGTQNQNIGTNLCDLKWGWVPLSIDPCFPNLRFRLHFNSNKKIKHLLFRTYDISTNKNFAAVFCKHPRKQMAKMDLGLKRNVFWLSLQKYLK